MPVIDHSKLKTYDVPGIKHQVVAGQEQGVKTMEVWLQTIEPGGRTPLHCHDCEEVIVAVRGSGRVTIAGETIDFGHNSTLIFPPNVVHEIINTGNEDLFLVEALGMAPVRLKSADGTPVHRPWLAP